MTLVTLAFAGLLAASLLAAILYVAAKRRVRRGLSTRKAIFVGVVAPFLGLLWIAAAFLIHVQISNKLAHQDCGLSGDPYVTLPNGYVLGSHNTYDGYIRAPGAQTDVPIAGPGYVRSIMDLQFVDGKFVGTQFDFKTSSVLQFVFDTRTQAYQSFPEGPLTWDASNDEAQRGAQSYWKLYAEYRHHWPNYIFLALILGGEGGIGFLVWKSWTAASPEPANAS